MPLKLTTYYHGKDIPDLPGNNTFHSKELFQIYEATPGYSPLLIVATEDGKPVARLLAAIRKTKKWLPSCLVKQCVVYGEGEFLEKTFTAEQKDSLPNIREREEEVFGEMLEHLTQEASRTCILIEFRNLDNSMFGYRSFRNNDYFPVNWLRVRNSLHSSKKAEDRFSPSRLRQIKKGLKNGAKVEEAHTTDEIRDFSRMLHKVYSSRIRRYFPANDFFRHMNNMLIKGKQAKIQRKDYRRLCMHLLRRQCFPLVFGRNEKDVCTAIPGRTRRLESSGGCSRTRFPPSGVHGCGTSFPSAWLSRFRTPLRRKTKQYPTLVPRQLALAE